MEKYYIIEQEYVGPNRQEHLNDHTVIVSTEPATTNSSHETRIKGWCGTTNDWSVNAHGEYDSIEAAEAAIIEIFGDVRIDDDESGIQDEEDTVVRLYLVGKFPEMNNEEIATAYWDDASRFVKAGTTDDEIDAWAKECAEDALGYEYVVSAGSLANFAKKIRNEKRAE